MMELPSPNIALFLSIDSACFDWIPKIITKLNCLVRDMKSAAKKRWGLFYGADGQKKTGGSGVDNIPPLTAIEENFLARVSWKQLLHTET